MPKAIVVDYEKCVGCRTCMQACSLKNEGVVNPTLSRVKPEILVIEELQGGNAPILCQQCQSAPCMAICPVKANYRNEETGAVEIDYDKCIGCRMCLAICPFGATGFNREKKQVFKCNLCKGDPMCVKFCNYKALQFVDCTEMNEGKRVQAATKVHDIMNKIVAAFGSGLSSDEGSGGYF